MRNKSYLIVILTLLIHCDTYPSDSPSFEKPLAILLLSIGAVFTYAGYNKFIHRNFSYASVGWKTYYGHGSVIATGNKVYFDGVEVKEHSWWDTLKAYTVGLTVSTNTDSNSSGISCKNNTIVIAPVPCNHNDLPLIKPSGEIESHDCDSIHTITIPHYLAEIIIDDNKQPHIEIDQAFKDLIFTTHNGILSVSTKDNKPVKFEYHGKPLVKIYAAIRDNSLTLNNAAKVNIEQWNQESKKLYCYDASKITGQIKDTKELSFTITGGSICHLLTAPLTTLKGTIKSSSEVSLESLYTTLKASVDYHNIIASSSAIYSCKRLTTKETIIHASSGSTVLLEADIDKDLTITATESSDVCAQGKSLHQIINVSAASSYYGKRMTSETAVIKALDASSAHLDVQKSLTGSASSASTVTYKTKPAILNVHCSSAAECKQGS